MIITMYELLGLVKDGKAPKKIKTGNIIYELDDEKMIWADKIYHEVNKNYIWLNFKHIKSLNDEVEILEEEKEIPEKLNLDTDELRGKETPRAIDYLIESKINQVIDYLKSKGE